MKSKNIAVVISVMLIALVVALLLVPSIAAKRKYDTAKQKLEKELPGTFTVKEFDSTMQNKLGEIETQWSCSTSEINGPHSQALKTVGMDSTVPNLATLFNYRIPAYAWFDLDQNARNMSIAAIQAIIVPISTDQTIHMSADRSVALVLHTSRTASIFRDTAKGLQEALWTKSAIEQDAAPDADKPHR